MPSPSTLVVRCLAQAVICLVAGLLGLPAMAAETTGPQTLRVGPGREYTSIFLASLRAKEGDTIEVDPGDYVGDVAVWGQKELTIRGLEKDGKRVRLIAGGRYAEGKGIWVARGGLLTVENIDFLGAKVPDRNGAGIRFEHGKLIVRNCVFKGNENGILTGGDPSAELTIENSEFGENGAGDGRSHNIYVGKIKKLTVTGSYFHHANVGHLLKSRASENYIVYNRLTDEIGGRASYELEFSNGGIAYVIGNIIEQGSETQNSTIVSFGAEGYGWPKNELYLINNTIADDRPGAGNYLVVKPGNTLIKAVNNLLVGKKGQLESAGAGEYANNFNVDWPDFVQAVRFDYRLNVKSALRGKGVAPGQANGFDLTPKFEYRHPHQTAPLRAGSLNPGALQSMGAVN